MFSPWFSINRFIKIYFKGIFRIIRKEVQKHLSYCSFNRNFRAYFYILLFLIGSLRNVKKETLCIEKYFTSFVLLHFICHTPHLSYTPFVLQKKEHHLSYTSFILHFIGPIHHLFYRKRNTSFVLHFIFPTHSLSNTSFVLHIIFSTHHLSNTSFFLQLIRPETHLFHNSFVLHIMSTSKRNTSFVLQLCFKV